MSASKVQVAGTVTAEIEGHAGATLDGAAGSPSTQCVTVQGNSSGTAIPTTDSGLNVAQGSTTSGETGPLIQVATVTSAPSYTNAETNPMTGDAGGCLRVNPAGQTGSFTTSVYATTAVVNATSTTLFTVPSGKKWVVKSIQITYVSSGTADTRQLQLFVNDASSHPLFAGVPANTQTAGLTYRYVFGPGLPLLAVTNSTGYIPMPELTLGPGAIIQYFVSTAPTSDTIQATACIELYND